MCQWKFYGPKPLTKNVVTTTDKDNQIPTKVRSAKRHVIAETATFKPTKIRTELNIEKWPAIWNPTHSKTHTKQNVKSRTLERETTSLDGTKAVSKVTINPVAQLGDLTTEDQRTLYALIRHWEDRGKPSHETAFSVRQMAKLLNKGWGTNVIDAVTGSLERLRGTLLVWTRSYRSKDQRVEDLETIYVNILSKLKIVRRKIDGHVTTEAGYFQFDDHILKNLLTNYTKPFLFDVFMDIKGEIALKLYSYIDLIMADKYRFERCTVDLFADLGLTGASYRNPSKRKQNLERALQELQGILLTTGVLKSATIEKTKNGKDYKVVFQKVARREFLFEEPATTFAATEPIVINNYSTKKDPLMVQAEELVRHFHKIFHGVDEHSPLSKETGQALSLISQHGFEAGKIVVDFAHGESVRTNFSAQHFGAVLSYTSRALAQATRQPDVATPARPVTPTMETKPESEEWKRGERRLSALTAEQYGARFESTKVELMRQNPFFARHWKPGGKGQDKIVRARLIREIANEPMSLLLFDPFTDHLAALIGETQKLEL